MRHFCHSFKFFLCTNNPQSQPRRSWVTCLWILFHCLPLDWKMQTAWGELIQLISSNHNVFLFFPIPKERLTCRSPLDFESIAALLPQTLYPFASLSFIHPIYLHYLLQIQAIIACPSLFNSLKGWANEATCTSSSPMHFSKFLHSVFLSVVLLKLLSKFTNDLVAGLGQLLRSVLVIGL